MSPDSRKLQESALKNLCINLGKSTVLFFTRCEIAYQKQVKMFNRQSKGAFAVSFCSQCRKIWFFPETTKGFTPAECQDEAVYENLTDTVVLFGDLFLNLFQQAKVWSEAYSWRAGIFIHVGFLETSIFVRS